METDSFSFCVVDINIESRLYVVQSKNYLLPYSILYHITDLKQ